MGDVRELLEKIEAGAYTAEYDSSGAFLSAVGGCERAAFAVDADAWRAYHGDLNAALALHKAVLPEWVWWFEPFREIAFCGLYNPAVSPMPVTAGHADPARAWLICILRALSGAEK